MEQDVRTEIDYIKASIDEIKTMVKEHIYKEDERFKRIIELEQFKTIGSYQIEMGKKMMEEGFNKLHEKIRDVETKGKSNLSTAAIWVSLLVGITSLIMWLIKIIKP